jgi:spore germination protein KB
MPLALLGFLTGLVAFDGAAEWGFIVSAVHPVWTYAAFIAPLLVLTVTALVRKQEQPKGKGQT